MSPMSDQGGSRRIKVVIDYQQVRPPPHVMAHTVVDNLLHCYASPFTGEKPMKFVVRKNRGGYFGINREHYLHQCWQGIIQRCTDPQHKYFQNGIRIDPAWKGVYGLGFGLNRYDKYAFFSFVYYIESTLGPRPCAESSAMYAFTIDRINPAHHYCPGNIRWAWCSLQPANQSRHLQRANTAPPRLQQPQEQMRLVLRLGQPATATTANGRVPAAAYGSY